MYPLRQLIPSILVLLVKEKEEIACVCTSGYMVSEELTRGGLKVTVFDLVKVQAQLISECFSFLRMGPENTADEVTQRTLILHVLLTKVAFP